MQPPVPMFAVALVALAGLAVARGDGEGAQAAPAAPGPASAAAASETLLRRGRDEHAAVAATAALPATAAPTPVDETVGMETPTTMLSTFFWNVHWECSVAGKGASQNCKQRARQTFIELAQASSASVVASVELSDGMSQPVRPLMPGWTQVDGPCARGNSGDSAALAFAPGWRILGEGGGCLRDDWDLRAFAVALAEPPRPVSECPKLCFIAIHAPHGRINQGHGAVDRVCGDVAQRCTVAMGDWKVPAESVGHRWGELIGGWPGVVGPNERTCCWPESHHYGVFDHVATNIAGAELAEYTIHPYQILEERPNKEHRPVSAVLRLPSGAGR